MECIRIICHKLIINNNLFDEYLNHVSRSNLGWLATMRSLGKVVRIKESIKDEELRRKILDNLEFPDAKDLVEKDLHLIELALQGDSIIFSFDKRIRRHVSTIVDLVNEIRKIVWQNPEVDGEDDFCEWLKDVDGTDLELRRLKNTP